MSNMPLVREVLKCWQYLEFHLRCIQVRLNSLKVNKCTAVMCKVLNKKTRTNPRHFNVIFILKGLLCNKSLIAVLMSLVDEYQSKTRNSVRKKRLDHLEIWVKHLNILNIKHRHKLRGRNGMEKLGSRKQITHCVTRVFQKLEADWKNTKDNLSLFFGNDQEDFCSKLCRIFKKR